VIDTLAPIADEIRASLEPDDFVLPAQRWRDPGRNREKVDKRKHPMSSHALRYLVVRVGQQAGIAAPIHPHLLRHAFADHMVGRAGLRAAQSTPWTRRLGDHRGLSRSADLGRASGKRRRGRVRVTFRTNVLPPGPGGANPVEAPTRIELVYTALQFVGQSLPPLARAVSGALSYAQCARNSVVRGEVRGEVRPSRGPIRTCSLNLARWRRRFTRSSQSCCSADRGDGQRPRLP
jgi:hypothetical protein